MFVPHQLYFDMGGVLQIPFKIEPGTAEGAFRYLAGTLHHRHQVFHGFNHVDPDAAPSLGGLDHQGKSQFPGQVFRLRAIDGLFDAGQHGEAGFFGQLSRPHLVSHLLHNFRFGSDEADAGNLTAAGKIGVFRQEPVPWMDRLGAGLSGRFQDRVHVQVAVVRRGLPHQDRFVGHLNMKSIFVGSGVYGYGGDLQFVAGANNPAGDLTAVGDQNLGKQKSPSYRWLLDASSRHWPGNPIRPFRRMNRNVNLFVETNTSFIPQSRPHGVRVPETS